MVIRRSSSGPFETIEASEVDNDSGVPGATVKAALDSLAGNVASLDSSDVANVSGVVGATVTAALDTLAALPVGKGNKTWNAAAPLVVTILPSGHPPGLYQVEISSFNKVVATGTYTSALTWDQPGFGAASLAFGSVNINATGLTFTVDRSFESSGGAAIVWTATPAGVSGSPNLSVLASAQRVAQSLP
jgi:hypothetical protein